ncbi:MAG: class I SAM-dependent methyltransferase [Anaerolineales bacterium]|nr:class I SAM-dependent methyltransferase [Anaerolineales bacterium]
MTDWEKESRTFDAVAADYDAYRPDYPEALIETIISETGVTPSGKILEIGSGTGKATLLFARRGFSIVCVEPGENLVAVAARKLKEDRVEFEIARFEEWRERANEFDLAMSAQAFHWIPKEIGYAKAARALKSDGHLALFWNRYPALDSDIARDLDRVYKERAPDLSTPLDSSIEELIRRVETAINESSAFDSVRVRTFPWSARYDTTQYLGLLNTYSDHLILAPQIRQHLFDGVAQVIARHGGSIERPYIAVLFVAQKRKAG